MTGFTLIELMIVIAIIGILVAIAIPQFIAYRIRVYDAKAKSELKSFYTVCAAYFTNKEIEIFLKRSVFARACCEAANYIHSERGIILIYPNISDPDNILAPPEKQHDPGIFWCMPVNVTDGAIAFHIAVKILISRLHVSNQ